MLEEAIRNYEKVHPADIALSMLSFLQSELPAGGTAAETRFLNLFVPLCECIFGPIVITTDNNFRHKDCGWMSTQNSWTRTIPSTIGPAAATTTSPSPRNSIGHPSSISKVHLPGSAISTNNSLDSDPVVRLLGAAGKPTTNRELLPTTLIEAISKESENRPSVTFPFLFLALPQPLQDAWLALIKQQTSAMMMMGNRSALSSMTEDDSLSCTKNDIRLIGQLLRKSLDQQQQLQLYASRSRFQNNKQVQPDYLREQSQHPLKQQQQYMSHGAYNIPSSMASPLQNTSIGGTTSPKSTTKEAFPESPNVLLSMLEYYLFLFLRFPLSSPERVITGSTTSSIPGVHLHRVQSNTGPSSSARISRESFGEAIYYHIFRRCMRHFLPYETEDNRRSIALSGNIQSNESELYLRLMIAFWLESRSRLTPTAIVVQSMLERRRHRNGFTNDDVPSSTTSLLDLNTSYDLTQTAGKYDPLPTQVHKCLRTLIIHAILDPVVDRNNLDYSTRGTFATTNEKWCMSSCMTILQQPVYNYIRTTFRFAPIHSSSESSFYGALNIWLIWLEPWNVSQSKSYTIRSNRLYCDAFS
jgi:hypothetical protein